MVARPLGHVCVHAALQTQEFFEQAIRLENQANRDPVCPKAKQTTISMRICDQGATQRFSLMMEGAGGGGGGEGSGGKGKGGRGGGKMQS